MGLLRETRKLEKASEEWECANCEGENQFRVFIDNEKKKIYMKCLVCGEIGSVEFK